MAEIGMPVLETNDLPKVSVGELVEAGAHFGHHTSRWNPGMRPYIQGVQHSIHLINLRETLKGFIRAHRFLRSIAAQGKGILFVGTKRAAKDAVIDAAQRTGMTHVSERWLGGTLTNYRTIRNRLARLEELEGLMRDGLMAQYSKKQASALQRELKKIQRNLGGIRNLKEIPGAVVIIDPKKEVNAVRECVRVGVPSVALVDTDSDPSLVGIPVPANDDAIRVVQVFLRVCVDAVVLGLSERAKVEPPAPAAAAAKAAPMAVPASRS